MFFHRREGGSIQDKSTRATKRGKKYPYRRKHLAGKREKREILAAWPRKRSVYEEKKGRRMEPSLNHRDVRKGDA